MRREADRTPTHFARQARPQTTNSNSHGQNVVETKKPKPNVFIVLLEVVGEVGLDLIWLLFQQLHKMLDQSFVIIPIFKQGEIEFVLNAA